MISRLPFRFRLLTALFTCFLVLIMGTCTVRTFEKKFVAFNNDSKPSDIRQSIAVFVYYHDRDLVGDTASFRKQMQSMLWGLSLCLLPVPLDFRWAQAPAIPEDRLEPIDAHFDQDFTEKLSAKFGMPPLSSPDKPTIADLIERTKRSNRRYLYLVNYNEYNRIRFESQSAGQYMIFTTLTGSMNLMSRLIIDTDTGAVLLYKQRLAETYYLFLLSNGWDQGFRISGDQDIDIREYLDTVGGRDEYAGITLSINYLLNTDFDVRHARSHY